MATATTTESSATKTAPSRKKLRAAGRKKRAAKINTDSAFKKTYFEAKSKRANDKKAAYRKKKSRKK